MEYVYVVYEDEGEGFHARPPFFKKVEGAIKHAETIVEERQKHVNHMKEFFKKDMPSQVKHYYSFVRTGELQWVGDYKNQHKIFISVAELH